MPQIFDYTDYRVFLEAYYSEKKAANPNFSFQVIAQKAGFSNKGFVYNLVKGKRSLLKSNVVKMIEALGLNRYEAEYFENLVAFTQARGLKAKSHYFEKLSRIRGRGKSASQAQLIRRDQYEFYSKWYHSAIRSIIDMHTFKGDYKWLAGMLHPPITITQAKSSVKLLLSLGLITQHRDGSYTVLNKSISTGQEIVGLAIQNFHVECSELARQAIINLPRAQRNITGLTLGISHNAYMRICKETLEFQERIMEIANSDEEADQVYQYNFHLFPISKTEKERTRP